MIPTLTYHATAARPAAELWLLDDDGSLIDFSSGYTFTLRVGAKDEAAILTKTTGITGAAGAGVEPTGTPNVVITWTAGELDIVRAAHWFQLTATTGGLPRVFEGRLIILHVIT
jgi:hypothetical protein